MSGAPSVKIEPGLYEHYKGNRYEVIGIAMHTETLDSLVLYRPMYGGEVDYWVRPYAMFVDTVVINNVAVPRFKRIE